MATDYENALDGFGDSDLMYDANRSVKQIAHESEWLRNRLKDAFKAGWDARGDADWDARQQLSGGG